MLHWIVISIVCLVALPVLARLLHRFRAGAGQNSAEVVINRPASEVWRYMCEPELVKRWVGGLVELEPLGETMLARGSRDRMIVQMGSTRTELLSEITRIDHGKLLAQRIVSGVGASIRFEEDATFLLDHVGPGTRLTLKAISRYVGIGSLLEPLITAAAQRKLAADLVRLKSILESGHLHAEQSHA